MASVTLIDENSRGLLHAAAALAYWPGLRSAVFWEASELCTSGSGGVSRLR